jgi:hypothetical protein
MSVSAIPRRAGARLDAGKLDFELSRRAVTSRRLAEVSGVHETVISRARHGGVISERNLQRLVTALLAIPVVVGADLLLLQPGEKLPAAGSRSAAGPQEAADGSNPSTSRAV